LQEVIPVVAAVWGLGGGGRFITMERRMNRSVRSTITSVRSAKPAVNKKDLPAKKPVKGGFSYSANDNITLVRACGKSAAS